MTRIDDTKIYNQESKFFVDGSQKVDGSQNLYKESMQGYSAVILKSGGGIADAAKYAASGVLKDMTIDGAAKSEMSQITPMIRHLNTDALAAGAALYLENKWIEAKEYGSLSAAVELQQFVDKASNAPESEILSKIYQDVNPHVARALKQAIRTHSTIDIECT